MTHWRHGVPYADVIIATTYMFGCIFLFHVMKKS